MPTNCAFLSLFFAFPVDFASQTGRLDIADQISSKPDLFGQIAERPVSRAKTASDWKSGLRRGLEGTQPIGAEGEEGEEQEVDATAGFL